MGQGTQFVPLTVDLIDEGEFQDDFNAELKSLQIALAKFRRQWGEKSKGAKAVLAVKITLSVESHDDGAYAIKTSIESKIPKRPDTVSLAIEGQDQNDSLALFVRTSGSDRDDPRQSKLATRDGRTIDPVTGEVID